MDGFARVTAVPASPVTWSNNPSGCLAWLLINEAPFPGERAFESQAGSQAAMQQVLVAHEEALR